METEVILSKATGGLKEQGRSYPWHWAVGQSTRLRQQHETLQDMGPNRAATTKI